MIINPYRFSSFSNTHSISLDGIDAYVDCGTNGSINFDNTDTFSFSLWVKRNTFTNSDVILSKMNPSGNRRGYFINLSTSNKIVFMLRRDTSFTSQRIIVKSTTLINNSDWHHIAITYDGTSTINSIKLYVDGQREALTEVSGGPIGSILSSGTTPTLIGALKPGTPPTLPAATFLDEVAIFGSVLTDGGVSTGQTAGGQIAEIYNGGTPNDLTSLSPISWWRFEEGSGTSVADSGSASNTGTVENTATFSTDVP